MGFWPYFLHEYSSGGMSAILELIAGTLMVLFTRFFLSKIKKKYRGLEGKLPKDGKWCF